MINPEHDRRELAQVHLNSPIPSCCCHGSQVKRDGHWQNIDAKFLVPTDCIALNAGAAVPADCKIISGNVDIDQAALTGESLPVTMQGGGEPKMGSTVVRGEVSAVVMYTGAHTFFGKTALLIQAASDTESNMQKVLAEHRARTT